MIGNRLHGVQTQKGYYQMQLRRFINLLFVCMISIIIGVVALMYLYFTTPESYFYTTSTDGQLSQILPVPRGTGLRDPEFI